MSETTQAADTDRSRATRTPDEIEAEIARTRETLAEDIDVLQERLSPASLAQAASSRVLRLFQRPDGSIDPVRTAVVAGVALVLVTYVIRRRRL